MPELRYKGSPEDEGRQEVDFPPVAELMETIRAASGLERDLAILQLELGVANDAYSPSYEEYLKDLRAFDLMREIEHSFGIELDLAEVKIEIFIQEGKLTERHAQELRLDVSKRRELLVEQERQEIFTNIERSESDLTLDVIQLQAEVDFKAGQMDQAQLDEITAKVQARKVELGFE